jgi:hypothetical protein
MHLRDADNGRNGTEQGVFHQRKSSESQQESLTIEICVSF